VTNRQGFVGTPFNLAIYVNRWAAPTEFASLLETLRGEGTKGVLKMLQGREIGVLLNPTGLGLPLTLAVQDSLPDGGRRVVIISPRRIYEKNWNSRSLDYPLQVIEMTFRTERAGEGTIAQLARLSIGREGNQFTVENYEGAKTVLKSVTAAAQLHEPQSR
jgi:hypothetical protein